MVEIASENKSVPSKLLSSSFLPTFVLFRHMSQHIAVPPFTPNFVNIDFEADLISESKATVVKDLESAPLLISLDCLLDGAPAHALAAAATLNLGLPFDMVYALKDDSQSMIKLFFERLRLHLDSLAAEHFVLIPFKAGSKFASVFALPSVIDQFKSVRAQLKLSIEKSSSETVAHLLKTVSPTERAAIKGKGKRAPPMDAGSRLVKPRNASSSSPAVSPPGSRKSLQTVLASPLSFSIPKKTPGPVLAEDNLGAAPSEDQFDADVLENANRLEVFNFF